MQRFVFNILTTLIGLTFILRLGYLQIIKYDKSKQMLDNLAIKVEKTYPERGFIYDRNNQLLVANQPAYDIMVIPRDIQSLDTLAFCEMLNISKEQLNKTLERAKRYSTRLPSVVLSNLSKNEYAVFQEKMRRFPGFFVRAKSLRDYYTSAGANVLGYISEVNQDDINKNAYYIQGENIGRTGIEKQYEEYLRGSKGVRYIQKDRFNREIGPYENGVYDTLARIGLDINITIDKELQEYAEKLMNGKRGGIVALEPKTGEILSMVSGPTYDPALLVGRKRSKNYTKLHYDSISKPTWDRSILAEPSPGSPFKVLNALAALQEGTLDEDEKVRCYQGFFVGGVKRGCHCGGGLRDLNDGLRNSCNAYFADVFKSFYNKYEKTADAHDSWTKHMQSFGLGNYLGTDLPTGRPGRIPNTAYYDRAYGKNQWYNSFIISNAIGQGEVAATPIQLANMTAAIANRGYFITPHMIKNISDGSEIPSRFKRKRFTTIDSKHFEPIVKGMSEVYKRGTARWIQVPDIEIAGKTGTVENFTIINGVKTQLTDHSVFVAFAPVENPRIALAVYIEHGYYGARYAGHIASLMIEKYLKGEISRKDLEARMLTKTLEHEYAKPLSGEPFEINEYVW